MDFLAIVKLSYEFLKLVPKFEQWIESLYTLHVQLKLAKIEMNNVKKLDKKRLILKKITEAKTHEEKAILFSTLNDIDRLPND